MLRFILRYKIYNIQTNVTLKSDAQFYFKFYNILKVYQSTLIWLNTQMNCVIEAIGNYLLYICFSDSLNFTFSAKKLLIQKNVITYKAKLPKT